MKNVIIFLVLIVSNVAIGQTEEFKQMLADEYKNTVPVIHPLDLYSRILEGEELHLLDTRKTAEYEVSSLKGAIRVGFIGFSSKKIKHIKKKETIIVYCTVGVRSETVGEELIKNGYSDVFNLYGGIVNWVNQGYPVYSLSGKPTTKVHVYSKPWGKWLTKGTPVY